MGTEKDKKSRGAPTKFDDAFVEQAFLICSETGATDAQLARIFKISQSTLNDWKITHKEFSESIKKGKDIYDSAKVEKNLLKRANGYSFTEVTREPLIIRPKEGPAELISPEMTVTKKVKKHIAPDVTAQIFWLKNRHPERWRDVQKHEVTGKDGGPIQTQFTTMPPQAKDLADWESQVKAARKAREEEEQKERASESTTPANQG